MHIRVPAWVKEEMVTCPFLVQAPAMKNRWKQAFSHPERPLFLELGCGKGQFLSELSFREPEHNFIAIDQMSLMLGFAQRKVRERFGDRPVDNVLLTAYDITRIGDILGENDAAHGLYLNFCNPWPRPRHHKKRLTHTRQLEAYKRFLVSGAIIRFKTDDPDLFRDSLKYFEEAGYRIEDQTEDLHRLPHSDNILTEHEEKFISRGVSIRSLTARYIP